MDMDFSGLTDPLFAILLGYLLGSLPVGPVLARLFGGSDPRATATGHTGATNVLRSAGKAAALLTLILDGAKGFAAAALGQLLAGPPGQALGAVAAVAGHCWPPFTGFRGGLGLAATAGALLCLCPQALAALLPLLGLSLLILRQRYRATQAALPFLPAAVWVFRPEPWPLAGALGLAGALAASFALAWRRDKARTP